MLAIDRFEEQRRYLRPVFGRDRVARFFAGLGSKVISADLVVDTKDVNGWPAPIGRTSGAVNFVMTIETDGALIAAIRNIDRIERRANYSKKRIGRDDRLAETEATRVSGWR